MEELTIGGNIYNAGNAREFKTGDWRSVRPVWIEEKCKQCGLCYPVCPDNSIPVCKESFKKRRFLIMIIAKDVVYVQKHAHLVQL